MIKLSLLFLPPIHKLGARESLRVSDAGSRGTEAANFETFHVFNFLMTKELGMENTYIQRNLLFGSSKIENVRYIF